MQGPARPPDLLKLTQNKDDSGLQSLEASQSTEAVVGDVADTIIGKVQSLQGVKTNKHVVCHRRQLIMTQVTTTASIHTYNCFTALLEYVRDHLGEQVPER